ncbi:MAG: restriction endonuclease subunit S [Anaerolineaceae bacterium]
MSSEGWKSCKLEDVLETIIDYRGKTPIKVDSGIPLITAKIVKNGFIQEPNEFIAEEDYDSWMTRGLPKCGDVVLTMEAPLGEVAQITNEMVALAQRIVTIRGKTGVLDNAYLKYYLYSEIGQKRLKERETGTTVTGIKQSELRLVKIDFPPFATQRRIAEILSSLDDKIELNRQTNATMEAIAQAIFKEWFVDFNFPGATGEMFESELGLIPKGWKIFSLDSLCKKLTDGSHYSPKSVESGFPMASVKDMNNWGIELKTCRYISIKDYKDLVRNDCKPAKNDILIAKDGSFLKHIFVVEEDYDFVVLSSIAILRPNELIVPHMLSYILKQPSVLENLKNQVSGAVLQRIVLKDFRQFKIVVPPKELQQNWFSICEPLIKLCWNNIHECEGLTKIHDVLLPKLMSGEIDLG